MKFKRRYVFIAVAVIAIVAVRLAWSPALLWFGKYQAIKRYANMQDPDALNIALSPQIRFIRPDDSEGQRVASELDGYRFSLPAQKFKILPGTYLDFDSDKLKVRCFEAVDLMGEFTEAAVKSGYYTKNDPYQIVVDACNARPADIKKQKTIDDLTKHMILLLLKTTFMPYGSETNWERIDTGRLKGIISGDISLRATFVELYLPESKKFASVLISPKDGANMEDVYRVIAELRIEPAPKPAAIKDEEN